MRTAAKAQVFTLKDGRDLISDIHRTITSWVDDKYEKDGARYISKRSGADARISLPVIANSTIGRSLDFYTEESLHHGELKTTLKVIEREGEVWALYQLLVGTGSGLVSPVNAPVRLSRYWKSIIDLSSRWHVSPGCDRVIGREFHVKEHNIQLFVDLLKSDSRRLPFICISDYADSELPRDTGRKFAELFKGLAHTCVLSEEAAWTLTKKMGQEWSCYNGAARIYWPFTSSRANPFSHPLFTQASITAKDSRSPYNILEGKIAKQIFDASCNLGEDSVFRDYERQELDERLLKARKVAEATQDYSALEELYAKENDRLSAENDQLRQEVSTLRSTNEQLSIALRALPSLGDDGEGAADDNFSPVTLQAALGEAVKRFSGLIVFGDEIPSQVERVWSHAGPPDKVFRFLKILSELSQEYMDTGGAIGCTVVEWMKGKAVPCSGESETKRNSGLYQWRVGGVSKEFELHLKPNEGTSPDRCVRIYFDVRRESPCVIVGFIGCKADLD